MTDQELKDLVARLAVHDEERAEIEKERAEIEKERAEIYKERAEIDKERAARDRERDEKAACEIEEIKRIQRETAEQHKKTEQVMEDLGRTVKEVCGRVDRVCGKMGGIDANLGHHAEQFFQDVFERKKEFGGIKYDDVIPNFGRNDKVGKMEVDIALINGDSVALIEVKNRIHPDFVTEFAEKRVGKFRALYPQYDNYKIYLGIAAFSFDKKVLESAKENGIGIVKQAGESVEIEAENLRAY